MSKSNSNGNGQHPADPDPRSLLGLWTQVGAEMRAAFDHLYKARSIMQDMLCSVPIERWKDRIDLPPRDQA
ncbi:MAG: hypothetical protein IT515_08095 [Burkholderiales bacterium]|nr:hypothetical protein [Burkholderiales bacterium]